MPIFKATIKDSRYNTTLRVHSASLYDVLIENFNNRRIPFIMISHGGRIHQKHIKHNGWSVQEEVKNTSFQSNQKLITSDNNEMNIKCEIVYTV